MGVLVMAKSKSYMQQYRLRKTKEQQPKKQTLDEFLGELRLSSPVSNYMMDKTKFPHGLTERQMKKFHKEAKEAEEAYQQKRRLAIQEYNDLVSAGKIIQPTKIEQLLKTASGNEDNPATQAARRLLTKRGVDWRTGNKL